MAFVDQLGAQAAPISQFRSGVYGMPNPTSNNDVLSLVNQLKDREMMDYKNRAMFDSNLALTQERRMREMVDPNKGGDRQDPNVMIGGTEPSAFPIGEQGGGLNQEQKVQAAFKQRELDQKDLELQQKGRFGQEALDIKSEKEKLDQQKSDQIHEQKINELNQKQAAAAQHIDYLNRQLADRTKNAKDQLDLHRQMAETTAELHKLEMARKDAEFQKTNENHLRTIADQERKLKDQENVSTTTSVNPEGTQKTTETKRGSAAETVDAIGKDGKTYTIPKEKLNDKDSDGTPHWKQVGGGQEQPEQPQASAFQNTLPDMSRWQPGGSMYQPPAAQPNLPPITRTGSTFTNPYQYKPGGEDEEEQ